LTRFIGSFLFSLIFQVGSLTPIEVILNSYGTVLIGDTNSDGIFDVIAKQKPHTLSLPVGQWIKFLAQPMCEKTSKEGKFNSVRYYPLQYFKQIPIHVKKLLNPNLYICKHD